MESLVNPPLWFWLAFNGFVVAMLLLDLLVFHKNPHKVSLKEAGIWSALWIGMALAFNAGLFWLYGGDIGLKFLTGYLIEKSLSVDNIFVFAVLFAAFAVPAQYQHRVLFIGIASALVLRAIMIFAGAVLIQQFAWMILVFGAFLVITGIRMAFVKDGHGDIENNNIVKLVRRFVPISKTYDGEKFFTRVDGRLIATPLLLVLIMIEATDVMFAIDSIPAIFAITTDPFIVYTSNVFAILGLRSLYFLLAGVMDRFSYLKLGLSAVLVFVGIKMLLHDIYKVPTGISLGVIASLLAISIIASLLRKPEPGHINPADPEEAPAEPAGAAH